MREIYVLRGALILVGVWFILPLASIIVFRLPPYAFGSEAIGVRFFQAWVPLRIHGKYPFLMVGFLLDLLHRGELFVLMHLGYDPARNLTYVMTVFSRVSIFAHTAALLVTSILIAANRCASLSFKLISLLSGASLGYTFYWAPLHLFIADYDLTLIVLGYAFLAFAGTQVITAHGSENTRLLSPWGLWYRAGSMGSLTAALLLLKPTLLPYALLVFLLGTSNVCRAERYRILARAVGFMIVLGVCAWLVLQESGLKGGFAAARELVSSLLHVESAEPLFRPRDLITPGTIYFTPVLGSLLWLAIAILALRVPKDRRARPLVLAVLAGGVFYGYVMMRRPGNSTMVEALIYLVLTGTLCLMVLSSRFLRPAMLIWSAVLLVHTTAIARVTLLPFIWSGRHIADVAQQVDEYARSFKLPIAYLYTDRGLAGAALFESTESAVVSGTRHCIFKEASCSSAYRNQWLSGLKPYELMLPTDSLPTQRFVLLFADVPLAPSVVKESVNARQALKRARACRQWEQPGFVIHVCEIIERGRRSQQP